MQVSLLGLKKLSDFAPYEVRVIATPHTLDQVSSSPEEDCVLATIDTGRFEAMFSKLLALEGDLREIKADLKYLTEAYRDSEERLRKVEAQRNWILGAFASFALIVSYLWRYVESMFKK